ncbi:hypothetical protein [Chryseobacterium sp. JM1]|uniref:hypothetical protein n=1 Tax=Chryseobacterium sp. JM1 TaxID=1233950 RepID=UPI00068A08FA|nr:hypothetical protein [Chryseobacterium sp. JM1]
MYTEQEILKIAKEYVLDSEKVFKMPMILLELYTIKKSYGYVFFYNSKKKFDNPESETEILGNAPFIVETKSGRVIELGTARSSAYYIEEYEAGRWPK